VKVKKGGIIRKKGRRETRSDFAAGRRSYAHPAIARPRNVECLRLRKSKVKYATTKTNPDSHPCNQKKFFVASTALEDGHRSASHVVLVVSLLHSKHCPPHTLLFVALGVVWKQVGVDPSHDDALGAASGLLVAVVHVDGLFGGTVGASAAAAARAVSGVGAAVVSANLSDNVIESLVDIDTRLCRRLDELAAKRTGQGLTLLPADLALALQIALVACHDHGEVVLVLHAKNLLLEGGDLLEALSGSDVVDKQEALASTHVLLSHRTVLLLSCGIEDIEQGDLIVNLALLAVGVFDCRVILVDEVALDQLDGQAGLADTTTADNDELVLSQEL
jgi:hypothetical protein